MSRLTAAIAVLSTGCAANFATTTQPTGEPLSAEWLSTFRQGDTPIDEQDFYRIAGDREAYEEIEARRSKGITFNRVGIVLALAGGAALISGAALGERRMMIGAIAMPLGGVMAFWGKLTAEKRPQLPLRRAQIVGDKYNASLGANAGGAP